MSVEQTNSIKKNQSDLSFQDIFENVPIGILVFDEEWQIISINDNFFKIGAAQVKEKKLVGKNLLKVNLFEETQIKTELNGIKKGLSFEKVLRSIRTIDGGEINFILKGTPLLQKKKFNGGILIIEDLKDDASNINYKIISSGVFDNFLSDLCDYFFIIDEDGKIIYSPKNKSKYEFFTSKFVKSIQDIFTKESSIEFNELLKKVIKKKSVLSSDLDYHSKQKKFILRTTILPFSGKSKKNQFVAVLLKNITGLLEEEENRAEEISELRNYQKIISEVVDALINIDLEGNITFWNDSAANLFGFSKSQVFGKFIGKIIPGIEENYFKILLAELLKNKVWEGEFRISTKASKEEYIKVRMGLVGEENKESIILLCSSVTKQVEIEKTLRRSEEHFRNIVTNSHEYICTLDLNGNITYANPFFINTFRYSKEELLNMNLKDLIEPAFKNKTAFNFQQIVKGDTGFIELPLLQKNGEKIFVLANFSPVLDLNNEPTYFDAILTDITEKKKAEADFLLTRSVFEVSRDGIAVQVGKKYILVNDSLSRIFGYKNANEIIGKDPLDLVAEEDISRVAKYIEARAADSDAPERYEFIGKRKDGSLFNVEKTVTTYKADEVTYVVSIFRDITDEKKAQRALMKSEERYRSITQNINEYLWSAERKEGKLRTVFYTDAVEKITSYSGEEFINDPRLWYKIIHPDDAPLVISKLKSLYRDRDKSNDEFDYKIINKHGNIIWIRNKLNIIRNDSGEIQKVFGIVSDITLEKKTEEELKTSAENLKTLNETKDRFISIVSHDLRTPFNSILGFTDILLEEEDITQEKQMQYISYIRDAANNMLSLVNSLLDWTHLQADGFQFEPERLNSKEIIKSSFQILSGVALKKNVELISKIEKELYVHADGNLLLQVFNNLISNAIKFTRQEGNVIVSAEPDIKESQIEFCVKDNGVGIEKENLDKLFIIDTKFTTNGTQGEKGSGLGLPLVSDIVKKHGGNIRAESTFGEGTEIFFTIPVASTTILLVDNTTTDRILYSKLIKSIIPNYQVIQAENGKTALEKIESVHPALMVSDHDLPGMNGYDLVKSLLKPDLKLKLPVVILSSDINETIAADYKKLGVEYVFKKPVNLSSFKNAIVNSLRKVFSA